MHKFLKPLILAVSFATLVMVVGCSGGGEPAAVDAATPAPKKADAGTAATPAAQPAAQPGAPATAPDKNQEGG